MRYKIHKSCLLALMISLPGKMCVHNYRHAHIEKVTPKQDLAKSIFPFSQEIEWLRKTADKRRGISWTITGDILLRDATEANGTIYAPEDYAIIVLSTYRAADKICQLCSGQTTNSSSLNSYHNKNCFHQLAHQFMHRFRFDKAYMAQDEDFWQQEVKIINGDVIDALLEIYPHETETGLNKKLRLVENYTSLDDTHYNINTKFQINGHLFGIEDKKWPPLTDEQKGMFQRLLKEHATYTEDWYTHLTSIEKKLVFNYASKLLAGKHCFPTQLRNIPGCRNAYQKSIFAYPNNNQSIMIGHYGHMATLSGLGSSASATIAQQNWAQVQAALGKSNPCSFVCLNHDLDIEALGYVGEQQIVNETKRTVGETFTCFPINKMGTFATPEHKQQTEQLLSDLDAKSIKNEFVKERLAALEQFNTLNEAKHKWNQFNSATSFLNPRNHYAEAGSDYLFLKSYLNQQQGASDMNAILSCKSGKDRTGYASLLSDQKFIQAYMAKETNAEDIHNAISSSGHIQLLASLNGGMPGRFGIKGSGITRANLSGYTHKALFARASSLTSID